ncbi:MAG: hypothetical protein LBR48_01695 [Dysgonamonadaceae bacterium]|jgi:hypothetical protein|nr:hypothetical protein [Dysgonamonadaceae bacterium]
MKYAYLLLIFIAACSGENSNKYDPANNDPPETDGNTVVENEFLEKIKGNSIQIDMTVLPSLNITPETLVSDLKKANVTSVHVFIANYWDGKKDDAIFIPEYMDALKNNGIAVWLMMGGNCFYGNTPLPAAWEMETLTPYAGIKFYSFHNDDYVNWQVERVKTIMKSYDFIGIEFAESYFPEWKTILTNGVYGDVSSFAREKFSKEYMHLTNVLSFDEIKNTPTTYQQWITYRADAVVNFNQKIKDAIKSVNPNTLFAAWGIGIREGSLPEIREHWGLDMERIVKEVKPDLIFIQTASQDWGDAALPYHYLADYSYIVNALKKADSKVVLGIQTDIASLSWNNSGAPKRTWDWWMNFCNLSLKSGYYTNTAYEYCFYKKQDLWK